MKIRTALVGIGNCASALIQGVEGNKKKIKNFDIGILPEIKDFAAEDIQFVLGFDVNKNKVGKDLSQAIFIEPNCALKLFKPSTLKAKVLKGSVLDGLDSDIKQYVLVDRRQKIVNVSAALKKNKIDVVVILLPTGSQKAAEYYAKAAISAGCAVVNGMPALIANNKKLISLATKSKVPIIGDDIKSQIGATIIHRALAHLFPMRGVILDRTIQLDWGGDMDFCDLLSNGRYEKGKRQSKTESVIAELPNKRNLEIQVSAVDYIPFLKNQKEAYMRLEGKIFAGAPVRIDIFMQVQDGFNSAGILADAIRIAMIGKKRKIGGVLESASAFFNKRPPKQIADDLAKERLLEFLEGKKER